MKLQVAMDVAGVDEALTLARQVAEFVDIIELGPPLIKHDGVAAISALKAAYPDKTILADMKSVEAGELEAEIAFAAGADLVTVLGAADDDTVRGAVAAARRHGTGVVADMITVRDRVGRARELTELGCELCEFSEFGGFSPTLAEGHSIRTVIEAGRDSGVPFSVAGVDVDSIRDVQAAGAVVAVAGSAIRGAGDSAAAARELRSAIGRAGETATNVPLSAGPGPHGVPVGPGAG